MLDFSIFKDVKEQYLAKDRRKSADCQNCGTELEPHMNYCHQCGQENHNRRVTVGLLFQDLMRDHWTLDNRSIRSIVPLITKPGFLTKEYMDGRRVSYNRPLRLYLFISFMFFLLAGGIQMVRGNSGAEANADTSTELRFATTSGADTTAVENLSGLDRYLKSKQDSVNTPEGRAAIRNAMEANIPILVFLLIPVLAMFVYGLFYKKDYFYADSFVFALHVQTFGFIVWTLLMITQNLIYQSPIWGYAAILGILLYVIIAAKRVFEFSWGSTVLRLFGVAILHFILTVLMVVAFLFILLAVYV